MRILFLILIIILSLFFLYHHSLKPIEGEDVIFDVQSGEGVVLISEKLEEAGVIRNKYSFILYNLFKGRHRSLKAGKYLLSPRMGTRDISEKLFLGDVLKKRVTIIEGWNNNDIIDQLEKKEICSREEFSLLSKEDFSYDFLEDNLEGYLFPDTYYLHYDVSCKEFVREVLNNFDSKLTEELRGEIERRGKSISEIIKAASLIEKEVRTFEDKKIVSGIIWRRIEIGMPLQIDATIAYLTGRRTTRISLQELKIDSPYNTYLNKGLPIAPISNPGIKSIKAAIYPKETNFLFYLSKPTGETIFSRNLEEHNIAKAKYLK